MLAWMAYRYSPTTDEPAHLVAGISHWKFERFDLYRVNPPLVRMLAAIPLLIINPRIDWKEYVELPYWRPEFVIGSTFCNSSGDYFLWCLTLARWSCIPLSLLGAYLSFSWARDLHGTAAGLSALMLWCFCPNILGNGALITPDAGAAALGLASGYCFWRWLRHPCWKRGFCSLASLWASPSSRN